MNRTEKAASETMGAAKAAKATIENLSGVFKELMREHGEVTALLMRLKMSSDLGLRRQLFPTIREALLAHEKGELAVVYPAFREHADLVGYADAHESEATTLEHKIRRLSAMPYDDGHWAIAFTNLVNAVSNHVKEEEGEYFPKASRVLGREASESMEAPYEAKKREIISEMRR